MEHNRCWAEISLGQLKENLIHIRAYVSEGGSRKVLAVVKADAYGHGAVPVARALEQEGIDALGVCCLAEGIELRQGGVGAPIVCLTGFSPGEEQEMIANAITPAITDISQVAPLSDAAAGAGTRLKCHVKIDSGMGRLGIPAAEAAKLLEALGRADRLDVEGLFTHFASSENFNITQAEEQLRSFNAVRARFADAGIEPPLIHMANTGALVARPETWANMVRPGSLLYGFISFFDFPEGKDRSEEFRSRLPIRPVLTLKARIYQVRDLPAGTPVGYGPRFHTRRPSRIAILPIGYADGWRRSLSGKAEVLVRGVRAPQVGTIGMDLTAVDVTGIDGVQAGEEAVLLGAQGGETISPSEIARAMDTVASEILSGIGKRVPRIHLA